MSDRLTKAEINREIDPIYKLHTPGLLPLIGLGICDFEGAIYPARGFAQPTLENGHAYAVLTESGRVRIERMSHENRDTLSPWHTIVEDHVKVRGLDALTDDLEQMNSFELSRVLEVEKDWKGSKTVSRTFLGVYLGDAKTGQEYFKVTQKGESGFIDHAPQAGFTDASRFLTAAESIEGGDLQTLAMHRAAAVAITCAGLVARADPAMRHFVSRRVGADISSGRPKKFIDPFPIRASALDRLSSVFRTLKPAALSYK